LGALNRGFVYSLLAALSCLINRIFLGPVYLSIKRQLRTKGFRINYYYFRRNPPASTIIFSIDPASSVWARVTCKWAIWPLIKSSFSFCGANPMFQSAESRKQRASESPKAKVIWSLLLSLQLLSKQWDLRWRETTTYHQQYYVNSNAKIW